MSVENKECGISDKREHSLQAGLKMWPLGGTGAQQKPVEGRERVCLVGDWLRSSVKTCHHPLATARSFKAQETFSSYYSLLPSFFLAVSSLLYLHIYSHSPVTSYSVLSLFCADNNIHCVWYETLDEPTVYREQSLSPSLPSSLNLNLRTVFNQSLWSVPEPRRSSDPASHFTALAPEPGQHPSSPEPLR